VEGMGVWYWCIVGLALGAAQACIDSKEVDS